MKIKIIEDTDSTELEVHLIVPANNSEVHAIYEYISAYEQVVNGWFNDSNKHININEIMYFESVDGKTFFYTETMVLETKKKLYEIENLYADAGFIRISKSTILSLSKVDEIIPELGRRVKIRLVSGEYLMVSRQYVSNLRKRLAL